MGHTWLRGDWTLAEAIPDLNQEVLVRSLLDGALRRIVTSTMDYPKSIEEISRDCGVPTSTCYIRVSELVRGGVLRRENIKFTWNRKGYAQYRATVRTIMVQFGSGGLEVVAVANGEGAEETLAAPVPLVSVSRRLASR